jgi:hypothetical protein
MGDFGTERVHIGAVGADQFVLFGREEAMTTDHGGGGTPEPEPEPGPGPGPGGGGGRAVGFTAPAHPLPTAAQAQQILTVLGISYDEEGEPPADLRAHLAGSLRALAGMWEVYAAGSPLLPEFRNGYSDGHGGNLSDILAARAHEALQVAEAARAVKPLCDAFLVPLTLAAAAGDVVCWGMAAAGEIAKDDGSPEAITAACEMLTGKLRFLYQQSAMLNEMLVLHGQIHHETGDCD